MQSIYMDISAKTVPVILFAKQGDVGRKFKAVLTDAGAAYSIPEDALLSVWYSGSSGEGNYSAIGENSAFTVEGNTIQVELIAQMLSEKGGGTLCLVMNSADGSQIGMWNIPYVAEAVPGLDSPEAEQNFTAFSEAAANIAGLVKQASDAAATFTTDTTLSVAGMAADAEAVGDALDEKVSKTCGLGIPSVQAELLSNLTDATLTTGIYACDVHSLGMPEGCGGGALVVLQKDENLCRQLFFGSGLGDYYMRWYHDGTWEEWEYPDPPMAIGVEYRTPERFMGDPVYIKLVSLGALPNAAYKTTTNCYSGAKYALSCTGIAMQSNGYQLTIPTYDDSGKGVGIWAYANGNIAVATNYDASAYTSAYAIVKYTKS